MPWLRAVLRRPAIAGLLFWLVASPVASVSGTKHWLKKKTEFGMGVEAGHALFQFQDSCVWFQIFFISDNFFDGLSRSETSDGPKFQKGSHSYGEFPGKNLLIDIQGTVNPCPKGPVTRPDEISIDSPNYGLSLMSTPSFQMAWRNASHVYPAHIVSVRERHKYPSSRWNYYVQIDSDGVSLTDMLTIEVIMKNGAAHAFLTAALR